MFPNKTQNRDFDTQESSTGLSSCGNYNNSIIIILNLTIRSSVYTRRREVGVAVTVSN